MKREFPNIIAASKRHKFHGNIVHTNSSSVVGNDLTAFSGKPVATISLKLDGSKHIRSLYNCLCDVKRESSDSR